jgi:hypothetical protein
MKITPVLTAAGSMLLVVGGILLIQTPKVKADDESSIQSRGGEIRIGFAIAPVKLDLRGKNPLLVGLGSYVVNAQGVCADCHSCPTYAPGHNPFPPPTGVNGDGQLNPANYLAGGVPFALPPPAGTIKSANLTPDSQGRPGGLTLEQFLNAIRTGAEPENPHERLSVMPWAFYRFMTDLDLRAIYEYLRAIPHAEPGTCVAPGQ